MWTSVGEVCVREDTVSTLMETSPVTVHLVSTSPLTRNTALIMTSAACQECVLMENVSTNMGHSSVSVCRGSNCPHQECRVWIMTSVWRTQGYA